MTVQHQGVTAQQQPREAPPRRQGPARSVKPPGPAVCRTCGAKADSPLPPGWASVTIFADPARTRTSKPYRRIGPYCSAPCAAAELHEAGPRAGIRPGPRPAGTGELEALMTQRPAGRP